MTANASRRRHILQNGLWYGGFWLLITIWLRLALPESIMGWERHQLFRFAADYWRSFSDTVYPILLYVQAFFTQFYLYPLLGAAVIGGLLVLGMGGWHRLTGLRWTGAVWAALMLPLIPHFNLLWILVWLVLLGGALPMGCLALWRPWLRYLVLGLMGLLGTMLLQENVVAAVVFWAVVYGVRIRSWKGGLCAFGWSVLGVALGISLLFWKGYPHYYTSYFQHFILLKGTYAADYFPTTFFRCPSFIRLVSKTSLVLFMLLPLITLLPYFAPMEGEKDGPVSKKWWQHGIMGLLLGGMFVFSGYLNLRYQIEDFYLVYRLMAEERHSEAVVAAETALFQRMPQGERDYRFSLFIHEREKYIKNVTSLLGVEPMPFQNSFEKEYMADALRVALLNDKKATERLFFYNGISYMPLLFTTNVFLLPAVHFVALYYTQNGLYAEALHLHYDLVTTNYCNTAVLEPLLWNSVVVKDYAPCRKFIRLFEQSLFHRDIARRYTAYLADTAATDKQADIAAARLRLSSHNHTVVAYFPDNNIHLRLNFESDYANVYEYALALWMIYKNHPQILAELPRIRQYYSKLPRHVQEAVLANFTTDRIDEAPKGIDPETKARYIDFMQAYEFYANGYSSPSKLSKSFGDTYWFHLYFNKLKPSQNKPEEIGVY